MRKKSALGSAKASGSMAPALGGAAGVAGTLGTCVGRSLLAGAADGDTPGVLATMAGSETDDGVSVGVTPALAAGKTCAFGSLTTSIMACARVDRSHPANDGDCTGATPAVDARGETGAGTLPIGADARPDTAGAVANGPPAGSLVVIVEIDLDTFEGAERVLGQCSSRAVQRHKV